ARQRDWCAAITLPDPISAASETYTDSQALALTEQTPEGIVVEGRRNVAPFAPFAEELLVVPPPRSTELVTASALAFAINCNARGLKLLCRTGADCVAVFDRVLIPSARIFLQGDVTAGDALLEQTSVVVNLMHQRAVNAAVTAELRLGLAARLARDAVGFPQVRERLATMSIAVDLIRSCLHAAENVAHEDRPGHFIPARSALDAVHSLVTRLYPVS
ncbi:MAG: 4-hydroxyphenylacetate 3-hydroxylase N-terminal domain-containing protein, partial [Candidatus Binataceae bacterium]